MSKLQRGRRNLSAHPPCPLWLAAHAAATSPTLPGLSQQDPAPRSDPSQRKRISSHSQSWLKGTRTLLLQRDTFSCPEPHQPSPNPQAGVPKGWNHGSRTNRRQLCGKTTIRVSTTRLSNEYPREARGYLTTGLKR